MKIICLQTQIKKEKRNKLIFNFIGNYSLLLSLITSLSLLVILLINIKSLNDKLDYKIKNLIFFQFFFILVSFFSLIILFIISEFSNLTVYNNSHTTKPLFYKISGTWGNHEGSLLLWLLILTFSIFLYFLFAKKRSNNEKFYTIIIQQIIIIGFSILQLKLRTLLI